MLSMRKTLVLLCACLAGLGVLAQAARAEQPTAAAIQDARDYAISRGGVVSFAVATPDGRVRGLDTERQYVSASVVKAMLLVAHLERADRQGTPIDREARMHLSRMIRRSDNDAADAIYASVGDPGLRRVAALAGMRRFAVCCRWTLAQITAADQARFFARVDRLVPRPHRRFARRLLSTIRASQTWGVPRVARPRFGVFFKGGWRTTSIGHLVHQVALLETGSQRFSIAVLTDGGPTMRYGIETIEGITRRLLRQRVRLSDLAHPGATSLTRLWLAPEFALHPIEQLPVPAQGTLGGSGQALRVSLAGLLLDQLARMRRVMVIELGVQ